MRHQRCRDRCTYSSHHNTTCLGSFPCCSINPRPRVLLLPLHSHMRFCCPHAPGKQQLPSVP
uniref:Uncharacterized protein MANES_15G006000 n=1 Tax=Rhizophora mucronata TaxID=61149 RepID=A0A2P2N1Z6_RHIMU